MTADPSTYPIAFFDSGVGGLTVVKALKQRLPNESILYLADTAHRPFGKKSKEELGLVLKKNIEILQTYPIKLLIIACHTACSYGLEIFSSLKIPTLGISSYTTELLSTMDPHNPLLILGTQRTILSGIYQNHMHLSLPSTPSYFAQASIIEELIETFCLDELIIDSSLKNSFSSLPLEKISSAILACTHFPIFKEPLQKALGSSISLIDPAHYFAEKIEDFLKRSDLLTPSLETTDQYLVTQDIDLFKRKFFHFFGDSLAKTNAFFNQAYAML